MCSISLGTAVIPRRIEKQRLCKIWGQKRCIMGNMEMCGVYKILNAHQRNSFLVVFWSTIKKNTSIFLNSWKTKTLKLAKMAFIGQETVRKQQRHNFLWRMYTLIAVFVHFNRFIDLKINFHTNPYNLASSMLLWFWAPCGRTSWEAVMIYGCQILM